MFYNDFGVILVLYQLLYVSACYMRENISLKDHNQKMAAVKFIGAGLTVIGLYGAGSG
jgi:hypothetical protein